MIFRELISLVAAAQRSVAAMEYHAKFSRAFMARSRGAHADPAPAEFMVGDQVFYWRGHSRRQGAVRSGKGMRAE
eukprot:4436070-Lingulodinium_polyedra.AAC.1